MCSHIGPKRAGAAETLNAKQGGDLRPHGRSSYLSPVRRGYVSTCQKSTASWANACGSFVARSPSFVAQTALAAFLTHRISSETRKSFCLNMAGLALKGRCSDQLS